MTGLHNEVDLINNESRFPNSSMVIWKKNYLNSYDLFIGFYINLEIKDSLSEKCIDCS